MAVRAGAPGARTSSPASIDLLVLVVGALDGSSGGGAGAGGFGAAACAGAASGSGGSGSGLLGAGSAFAAAGSSNASVARTTDRRFMDARPHNAVGLTSATFVVAAPAGCAISRAAASASGGQRAEDQLADVERALDGDRIADPADVGVLVAGGEVAGRDVGHEREVQVQALAARRVLLVADEAGRAAVDADARRELALEAGLLAELAAGGLERRLARLELATDGEPEIEALVAHEEDLAGVPAEDGHRERAAIGHGASLHHRAASIHPGQRRLVPQDLRADGAHLLGDVVGHPVLAAGPGLPLR